MLSRYGLQRIYDEKRQETFRKKMKASERAFDRIKEAFELVAQDATEKMSIVQEIMFKSTDYLRRIIAPVGGQGGVKMSYLCLNCNSFPLEDYVWWVAAGKTTKWWCAICGEKYQTGCRLCQQEKVLSRRPQGLCANLINALKLLANQQEDGDGLLQNVMTNLGKGSRKGLRDGLRDFIRVDNDRALDVGELRRGTGTFKFGSPKVPEGRSDITGGRSEYLEVVDRVKHIEPERWGPPLLDADWYAFCQALYKDIEGKYWEEMYDSYKVMSKALGVKKPQESQKAKALRAMKAAKNRREEFYDLARISFLGKSPQRSKCCLGQSPKVRGRSVLKLARGLVEARQQ